MPTILIDADGCPVVDLTVRIGRAHGVPVKILCDTAHRIEREGAKTLVFDKGADSVDFFPGQPGAAGRYCHHPGLWPCQYVPGPTGQGAQPERS